MTSTTVDQHNISEHSYVAFNSKYSSTIVHLDRDYKKAIYSNDMNYLYNHKHEICYKSPIFLTDIILLISTHGNYEMFKYLENSLSDTVGNLDQIHKHYLNSVFPYLLQSYDVGDNLKIIVSLVKYHNVRIYMFLDKYDDELLCLYKRIRYYAIYNVECLL